MDAAGGNEGRKTPAAVRAAPAVLAQAEGPGVEKKGEEMALDNKQWGSLELLDRRQRLIDGGSEVYACTTLPVLARWLCDSRTSLEGKGTETSVGELVS